jgi:CRISPR-associated endonuclease Cas3-HD
MEYLAHSERDGIPAQTYVEHVRNVKEAAVRFARAAVGGTDDGSLAYAQKDGNLLIRCAEESSEWHDLGKLLKENQAVLRGIDRHDHLKTNHADAGAAVLMKAWFARDNTPALAVYSHHRGLPNIAEEESKEKDCYRDIANGGNDRRRVNMELESLNSLHRKLTGASPAEKLEPPTGDFGIFSRMLLSCLADADHTDTAIHYQQYPEDMKSPQLRAEERLEQLDRYVEKFPLTDERNKLRAMMYQVCKHAELNENIVACDSPVGSGKTTAVMAHLLNEAIKRKARRVFVILPFTNIIKQSVEVYREALVLPGEDPTEVVAELHHRADFQSVEARVYNAQWRAPIIVTTAVAFFETIASNRPAALRRLHELPGSVIFVDEAHAALPVKLLPVAWHWMQILADEWSCYWVLASGSLVEFWKIREISEQERCVPQLVEHSLRQQLTRYEDHRIQYQVIEEPLSREALIEKIKASPGPRLVIMNTVQSAAVIANDLVQSYGGETEIPGACEHVMHLSTALTAEDREATVEAIKKRLKPDCEDDCDTDWTLVATSCVEAGVDFSFHTGFREISSLLSLLQAAGRIGRNGEYNDSRIWSFTMQDDKQLTSNRSTVDSEKILQRFFQRKMPISPQLCTRAIVAELSSGTGKEQALLKEEQKRNYAEVGARFKVIDSETVIVIVDEDLKQRIRYGQCDWRELQRKGIPVRLDHVKKLALPKLIKNEKEVDCIYNWNLRYDSFLGIMSGVLDEAASRNGNLFC